MLKKVQFTTESTLAQQCYEQLYKEILDGILKPGEKLKVEPIKQRFDIGQSPVREALSRLVASGLVEVEENKGFRVSEVSEADIRDTYSTFTLIENNALALAIEKGDDNWQASIISELYKLSLIENKEAPSYAVWAERNYNFHVALIAGCNSPAMLEIRRAIYMKFDRYCRMAYHLSKRALSANHAEHQQLAQAILDRDTKKAQALMTYHINAALEDVIKKFKDNQLL
jgi:GntR family carbon starvation induced transcriptional regulator